MKNTANIFSGLILLVFIFLGITLTFFFSEKINGQSKEEKTMQKIMNEVIFQLEDRNQLRNIGLGVSSTPNGCYQSVSLTFNVYRPIKKEEARKMLLDAAQFFCKKINSNEEIKAYLEPYPFTNKNIGLTLFCYQKNGNDLYYPDFTTLKFDKGTLYYKSNTPETYDYIIEEETYEEALYTALEKNVEK